MGRFGHFVLERYPTTRMRVYAGNHDYLSGAGLLCTGAVVLCLFMVLGATPEDAGFDKET